MAIQHILFIPHVFTKTFTHHWKSLFNTQRISPQSPASITQWFRKEPKMLYLLTAQIQKEGKDSNMEVG